MSTAPFLLSTVIMEGLLLALLRAQKSLLSGPSKKSLEDTRDRYSLVGTGDQPTRLGRETERRSLLRS